MSQVVEYENREASAILVDLNQTYGECLDLSRDYTDGRLKDEIEKDDVDLEALANFLEARAELFRCAENSLAALSEQDAEDGDSGRNLLTAKAVSILEEMTEVEERLTGFLNGHLNKMQNTIGQMRKAQPVFRRYSHLGGPIHPSRIDTQT